MTTTANYQPVERRNHSSIKVGDYLYMWGGYQPCLPDIHDNEKKKLISSVMEVCHLPSGRWEQKPTTGTPPLGVAGYGSAVIGSQIYFFGGACGHFGCYHNSLYSFNVDTFNWKELSPTSPHHGPMMKSGCGSMVALKFENEDYLVVMGGSNMQGQRPGTQHGAEYGSNGTYQCCNEVHYYKLSSDEWISPTVTGDRLPPIDEFTLTSVANNTAILFGGNSTADGYSNKTYSIKFSKTSVDILELPNPGGSVQWPKGRFAHSSVLISSSSGPHLLVVGGGGAYDCWLFDIIKRIWKPLFNIPDTVTGRQWHSLSVWSVTPTTNWIIAFGGMRRFNNSLLDTLFSNTRVLELRYTDRNDWSASEIPLDQYQEKLQERRSEWEESQKEIRRQLQEKEKLEEIQKQLGEEKHLRERERIIQQQVLDKYEIEMHEQRKLFIKNEERIGTLTQQLTKSTALLQQTQKLKEDQNEQLQELKSKKEAITKELHEATKQIKKLHKELKDEKMVLASLIKQKQRATDARDEDIKNYKEVGVQFDFLITQSDLIDSSVTIAGQKLFHLQGDRSHSLSWEKYGFRLQCPKGAVSKDTEVAVTTLVSGKFNIPKGTVLVSAVYAISVSKPLLKSLTIELQHCVDLRNTGQTGCLKFVRGPLKSPYKLSPVEGGVFCIRNRYGSIKRDNFSFYGIVAEMHNGDTPSDSDSEEGYETPPEELIEESNGDTTADSENEAVGGGTEGSIQSIDTTPSAEFAMESTTVSSISIENEVKEKLPDNSIAQSDILYTGMMYHKEKNNAHWKTMYTVVRDLDVLIEYLESKYCDVDQDSPDCFKFTQPDGVLRLCLETPQEKGWIVHPRRDPMELRQSVVDKFQSKPMPCSFDISVYAKPDAQDPLHCPIKLIGIDPETTIYINRPLPLSTAAPPPSNIDNTTSTSSTTGASQTSKEIEESTFRSDIAYRVMIESTSLIKGSQVSLTTLANKLLEKKVISAELNNEVMDPKCGLTADERKDKLLKVLADSIKIVGKLFGYMVKILKDENTVLSDNAAETILKKYTDYNMAL